MGALFIGACVGRRLGYALNIPCVGVHHKESHLFAAMIKGKRSCALQKRLMDDLLVNFI
jgi:tRNA A37 threonylcarbamoyltransferase TsaD